MKCRATSSMSAKMSPPSRAAWIEILLNVSNRACRESPPSRAAWIEILLENYQRFAFWSPPSRAAWIEIQREMATFLRYIVAAFTGGVD